MWKAKTVVVALAVGAAVGAGACGGSPDPGTVSPEGVALRQVEALLEPSPVDRCAAQAVVAAREDRVTRLTRTATNPVPGESTMNLSQLSGLAASAHVTAQSSAAAARGPGNARQLARAAQAAEQAQRQFDAVMHALDRHEASGRYPSSLAGAAEVDLAYARAWSAYFQERDLGVPPESAAMTATVDRLTDRGVADGRLLDDYVEDFMRAFRDACGGSA